MEVIIESMKLERLMGLKMHHDDFKPTNSIEWRSVVASMR